MATLEEELALRFIEKQVRPNGSVDIVDGQGIDEGVAIWDKDNTIIGRIDYEPVGDGTFLTNYWWFDSDLKKIFKESRIMSQIDLYTWINNDSQDYYLKNIKDLPTIQE